MDTFVLAAGKIPTITAGAALLLTCARVGLALGAGGVLMFLLVTIVGALLSALRGARETEAGRSPPG
jgi:hypothetical protein